MQRVTMTNMHNTTLRDIQLKLPYIRLAKHPHWSLVAVQFPDIDHLTSPAYITTFAKLRQSGK